MKFYVTLLFSASVGLFAGAVALTVGCAHVETPAYESPQLAAPGYESALKRSETTTADSGAPAPDLPTSFHLVSPLKTIKINQNFSEGVHKRDHLGVDLGGHRGDPIYAAHSGVIVFAGTGFHGFGKLIIIEHDKEWATLYAHLNRIRVKTGRHIRAGDRIGDMGRTGHATGVHLHFELLHNKQPVNPMPYLPAAAE